ncbi:MAG: endonuclease/exonuclease/phosphatase family protein [Candidatus Aminicenantaceae bacterium]|jgi:endonuclease/exonuclease/phosphatase family metal-dependent hydrolase
MSKIKFLFLIILFPLVVISCTVTKNYRNPERPEFSGNFATKTPNFDGTIKVVTFNIKLSEEIQQAIEDLGETPELWDADIILLQEMADDGVATIAQRLNYNFIYYPASIHYKHGKNYGNAILSKWPIKDYRKIVLPYEHPMNKQIRIAALATVVIGKFEILTYSVHTEMFWLGGKKKLDQVDSVLRSVADHFEHVIIGGDFNTNTANGVRETEKLFTQAGFLRASKRVGATSKVDLLGLTDFELDHIFVKGLTPITCGKCEETQSSDHYPVWVTLRLQR